MKRTILSGIVFLAGLSLASQAATAQSVVLERKGNVTIVAPPSYDDAAALANIETAAGGDVTSTGTAPAVTIANVPHQPAFDPLKGEWRPNGPVFQKEAAPLSLRDRVRNKLADE